MFRAVSADEVGYVDADIPARNAKNKTVSDELSTQPGMEVTVKPSGNLIIKRTRDPEWEYDERDQKFDSGEWKQGDIRLHQSSQIILLIIVSCLGSEDEEDEEAAGKRKKKDGAAAAASSKKQKTKKNKDGDESSSDDEDNEIKYMKRVAEEEEQMEKAMEVRSCDPVIRCHHYI